LLSSALAERVGAFGILVNERFSVSFMDLQPNEAVQEVLKEESVAKTIGSTAVHRGLLLFE